MTRMLSNVNKIYSLQINNSATSLHILWLGGEIRFSWRCEYRLDGGSKPLYEHMIHKLQLSLDKRSQWHTSTHKFWWASFVIKVKLITVTWSCIRRVMSIINDAQTNRVCALSISITSYFCLNTAQYIVEYSDVNSDKTLFYLLLLN